MSDGDRDAGDRDDAGNRGPARGSAASVLAELGRVERLAREADRSDLVARCASVRRRLSDQAVPIAVLGEFKQGKSTLVNALVRTEVCPVDPDVGTAVPTFVRYGSPGRAAGHPRGAPADETVPLDVRHLAEAVSERARSDLPPLASVEVFLDRALLRTGVTLIDTPGLGGLESEHGYAALGVLPLASAALFVTDASQELTEPELGFLRRVVAGCPTVVVVVTKTDLHADWRRVVDLDREHLAAAGLRLPVVPVSSFLRMHAAARRDPALHEQSGFPALLDVLRARVLRRAAALAAKAVRSDLAFVTDQLRLQVAAERQAVRPGPGGTGELVDRLAETAVRADRLTTSTAGWQLALRDGIEDLGTEVDHDLRQRLLSVVRAGEAKLEAADPEQVWAEFQAWLRAEVTAAAVANVQTLVDRAQRLAADVALQFDGEVEALDVDLPAPGVALGRVTELRVDFSRTPSRRLLGLLSAARVSYMGGMLGFAGGSGLAALVSVPALVGSLSLAPLGIAVSLPFARKLVRDDRARELELRRQQARQEFRRYVDEVGFVLGKESRDAVRRAQRHLRDEFGARAAVIQRSAAESLAAAERGASLPPARRVTRARELDEQWRRLSVAADPAPGRVAEGERSA